MTVHAPHRTVTVDAFQNNACEIVIHLDSLPAVHNVDVKLVADGHVMQVCSFIWGLCAVVACWGAPQRLLAT